MSWKMVLAVGEGQGLAGEGLGMDRHWFCVCACLAVPSGMGGQLKWQFRAPASGLDRRG